MGAPSREDTPTTRRNFSRGSVAALSFVVLMEFGFGFTFRYLVPNLAVATLDELYFLTFAIATAGTLLIYRYLPDSKKPAFDLS